MDTQKPEAALKLPVDKQGNRITMPPHRPNKSKTTSLTARIRLAKTVDEVDKLMSEGDTYKGAALSTRKKWVRVATHRKLAITNPPVAEKIEAKKAAKK